MNNDLEIQKSDPSYAFLDSGISIESENNTLSRREIGKAHYRLAKIHYDKSDLVLAEQYFKSALSVCERPGDIYSMFKMLGFLIRIASEKLEDDKAQKYILEAENLVEELPRLLGSLTAEYFFNIGIVKNYRGLFHEAKENFNLAYNKSKEENEPELLAKCLLSLATNSFNTKDFEGAREYLIQLEQLLKIIKKTYLKGSMYLLSGKIYLELGQYQLAIENFQRANESLQTKKCWNLLGYVLLGRGNIYKRRGEFDKALTFYKLALESIDQSNFKRLSNLIKTEINDVNDSSVDLYLDRTSRKVKERNLGTIDFKHRFVLLEILFLLAKNAGTYFDKEKLAKAVWKDEYNPLIHDKLIYTSVSRLRKLIEPKNDKGEKRKYIIRGKDGYTFNPMAKIRFHLENKATIEKSIANVELSSPV
jgi:tetratricopeptide (TPR) repeat protein